MMVPSMLPTYNGSARSGVPRSPFIKAGALQRRMHVTSRRPRIYTAASLPQTQELLEELQAMDDDTLTNWALANRASLTLDLLSWIAGAQSEAAAAEKERLWALGSKLMAVREGLVPVGNEVLQEELQAAAQRACLPSASRALRASSNGSSSSSSPASAGSSSSGAEAAQQEQQQRGNEQEEKVEAPAEALLAQRASTEQQAVEPSAPRFSFMVQRTAQLGMTPEGLMLLQQQATALKTVVGGSRAKSLAEVIGRKELAEEEQQVMGAAMVMQPDAAVRILQLLVSIPSRQERADLLPDAFTPLEEAGPAEAEAEVETEGSEGEEELLSTTPLALLQAIDLQLSRLLQPAPPGEVAGLLGGGELADLPPQELKLRLQQLREDVMTYWGELGNTSGEEF